MSPYPQCQVRSRLSMHECPGRVWAATVTYKRRQGPVIQGVVMTIGEEALGALWVRLERGGAENNHTDWNF